MKRVAAYLGVIAVAAVLGGCASMEMGSDMAGAQPQVKLDHVEVASYFPYAPPPARVPLVLAFVFDVTNPSGQTVTLEELRFAYAFEAKGAYFTLNSPAIYETIRVPAKASTMVRVVSVLDSAIVPATLAVTQGFRLQELGLKGPDVVKEWWEKIGDFPYGIRVSEGVATFATSSGPVLVSFQDMFPKR